MKPFSMVVLVLALFSCAKPLKPVYTGYRNLHLQQVGLVKNVLRFDIGLYNPNSYALQIKSADLQLYANNRFLGTGTLARRTALSATDTTYIPLQLTAGVKDLLTIAVPAIRGDSTIAMRIEGNVQAGRKGIFVNVPVNYNRQVPTRYLDSLLTK